MSFKFRNDYKFSDTRENDLTRFTPNASQISKNDYFTEETKKLKEDLTEKTLEIQDLQTELSAIKQLVDNKDQNMLKLKEELKLANIANKKAIGEQRFFHEEIFGLQKEQEKMLNEYEMVLSKLEAVNAEKNEKNKYIEHLEGKIRGLEEQNSELHSQNIMFDVKYQELKLKEQESQHEIKLYSNQITTLQEQEDEFIGENKELKVYNEELSEKVLVLAQELLSF